jgi:hypothetical protein
VNLATQLALAYVVGKCPGDAAQLGVQLLDFASETTNIAVRSRIVTYVPTIIRMAACQTLAFEQAAADAPWCGDLPRSIPPHEGSYLSVRAALIRSFASENLVADWDDLWKTVNLVSKMSMSQAKTLLGGGR